jgi:hypothetical protein
MGEDEEDNHFVRRGIMSVRMMYLRTLVRLRFLEMGMNRGLELKILLRMCFHHQGFQSIQVLHQRTWGNVHLSLDCFACMHDYNLDLYLFHLNLMDWMNDGAGGDSCHLSDYGELLLTQTFPGFLRGKWDELIVVCLQLPLHHLHYAVDSGGNEDYVGGDGVDWAVGDDEDLALGLFDGS